MVPRSPLVRRLVACRDVPLVVIVAPPGYGKTTLLAEWATRDERPFSWISPDAVEVERFEETREPRVIVVDDAHLVPADVLRSVAETACRAASGTLLALASRRRVDVRIGRWRAHRLVTEITADDLRMTRLEAAVLLHNAGADLEGHHVDRLLERTRGWPAALYLAALSISQQPTIEDAVARFGGGDRLVADYVISELLAPLSEPDREFLRRTSILAELTPPLCDAVTGARGSGPTLAELVRTGMPIEPLDRCDTAFRYHPLLAETLRAELARVEPELTPVLHRRAAVWHARHGEPSRALPHAIACGDSGRAGALLWSLAPGEILHGRAGGLGRWLARFTDVELSRHPPLALTAAVHHLAEGRHDRAQRAIEVAETVLTGGGPADDLASGAALLRACVAGEGIARMGEDAARACALSSPDSVWATLALFLSGVAQHLAGDRAAASATLEAAATRGAPALAAVSASCNAQLALLAVERLDWEDATRHAREAVDGLAGVHAPAAVRALAHAAHAVVDAQQGKMARARHDARDARRLLGSGTDVPTWLLAETHVWLARAEIRLSDGPTARSLLARAARLQSRVPDAPVLAEWIHEGWARADAFAANATGDGPTLTNAELRVLRLLPSHLTFREIGERLHVSTNTVKTQALAVYRKLDVSSRSGAVSRARSIGLIDAR